MGTLYFGYPDGSKYEFDEKLIRAKLTLDDKTIPDYIPRFDIPMSVDAEISVNMDINIPMFEKTFGVDLGIGRNADCMTLICKAPYQDQVRKHKKRRINKKWAKRYGYRTKFRQVEVDEFVCEKGYGDSIDICGKINNLEVPRCALY